MELRNKKRVTKKSLLLMIELKKEYLETKDKTLLADINYYIENVINKDRRYYHKLLEYDFTNEQLEYLL